MGNFTDTLLDLRDDFLDFVDDHRTLATLMTILAVLIIVAGIAFSILYKPVKITIVNANPDEGEIYGTRAFKLDFKANVVNADNIEDIEWDVSGGGVNKNSDGSVTWNLPTIPGTYELKASLDGKETVRKVTVMGSELEGLYLKSDYQILVQDSDGDGLPDIYEGSNSRTSQTSKDTDEDGLYDGDEISFGLDPLNSDSKGDGIKDGQRKLEYKFTADNVSIKMTGSGNFLQTTVDKYTTESTENVSYIVDGIYTIHSEAELENAEITIKYDKNLIKAKSVSSQNLAVYSLNDIDNTFQKIKSTINENDSTITFDVTEFGKYFLADSSKLTSNLTTELVFLIDNSGSMYSAEEVQGSEENDVEFKRVDVVNELVDKLKGAYKFGAGKFTFEYKELVKLTDDKTTVKNSINNIKTVSENFTGTYIGAALEGGLKQFTDEKSLNRRYVILLTDGSDTSGVAGYRKELLTEQIKVANEKNVKVYTIGLGETVSENDLKKIADQTNGKYYFAATSDDLEMIFELISSDLNYNLCDTTMNGENDSIIIADSGLLIGRDTLSFANFANTQEVYGYGYGMALYTKLFYEKGLPSVLGAKTITTKDGEKIKAPSVSPSAVVTEKTLRKFNFTTFSVLSNPPANYWTNINGSTLQLNQTIKSQLQQLGFEIYTANYDRDKALFNRFESIKFDIVPYIETKEGEEPTIQVEVEDDDIEMLKVLARLDITKYKDEKFYFYDNNDTAFENLKSQLANGTPVLIRINDDYTVLAVKLLADVNNMNKYKIEVYDPNFGSVSKYIEVERNKFSDIKDVSKVIVDKYEYKFKYQGSDVGICVSIPNVVENI